MARGPLRARIPARDGALMPVAAHRLVLVTAREMAGELYETMMSDNEWYSRWREANPGLGSRALEARFIAKNLAQLFPQARAALAASLRSPNLSEADKEVIMEALVLDSTLRQGRGPRVRAHQVLETIGRA